MNEEEKKYEVTLFLKYGHKIEFMCTDFTFTRNGFGVYTNFEWKGANKTFGLNLSDLIGYTAEEITTEENDK